MRDAAKNPGMGGMFGAAGIGLGMGARVGNQFAQNLDEAQSAKSNVQNAAQASKQERNSVPNAERKWAAKPLANARSAVPKFLKIRNSVPNADSP